MACQTISALPVGASAMSGTTVLPGEDSTAVTRKFQAANIAQSATAWAADIQYQAGTRVKILGTYYRANAANIGQNPETSASWSLEIISSLTIQVPSAKFPALETALAYLRGVTILDSVTIQLEDGSYNYADSQIDLSHPYGDRIFINGNLTTPASCVLSFSSLAIPPTSPYLSYNSGNLYATGKSGVNINGFSILRTGGAPEFGHCAILASNGATINVGPSMIINGFWANMASLNGGNLLAEDPADVISLVTELGTYAIYSDGGYVSAPAVAVTGPGNAVFAQREARIRVNNSTIAGSIVTAFTLEGSHLIANGSALGAVDIVYLISGSSSASDTGATIAAPSVAFVRVDGQFVYNDTTLVGNSADIASANIQAGTVQHGGAANATVFLEAGGIDTRNTALAIQANNITGIGVSTTGATTMPVSLALGATSAHTGIQGGSGTLNASGILTVAATWVTANTVIVPEFNDVTATGPRLQSAITPSTSFTLTSGAGAADSGKLVRWIAIVYP